MLQRIVFLDRGSVPAPLPPLDLPHHWEDHDHTASDQVAARLQGAAIAVVNKVRLNAEVLGKLPDLRMIALAATGSDNVDLAYCRQHGIVVSNIRGYASTTVPEHVMTLMLDLRRNLLAYRTDIQAGRWPRHAHFCFADHSIQDLGSSTLAIVGSGSLGQGVARLARAFGMHVLQVERKGATTVRPGYRAFADALAEADVISLHCPLTPQTRHLIGAPELAAMKPGAVLVNTARGALIDDLALAEALRQGRVAAGLDVLNQEPPPADHPLLAPDLLARPNFLLTPHIAWASQQAVASLAAQLIENIRAYMQGHPRNQVG